MDYLTVTRDDSVYECFPDLARLASGRLVVAYRESDHHVVAKFSRIVVRVSDDDGETWSARIVVAEGPDVTKVDAADYLTYDCPRMRVLQDGRLLLVCNAATDFEKRHTQEGATNFLWWSDDGESWSDRQETGIPGIVPDRPCELADGTLLIATHWQNQETDRRCQYLHRSTDGGLTWPGPITLADDGRYNHCEASILRLPDGELVCYMRENSRQAYPGFKCFSADGGLTWDGPYPTLMIGCHRPTAGLLASGRVLVTYRLLLHGAGRGAHNLMAYLEEIDSTLQPTPDEQSGQVMMLDHDNSPTPDTGYSGWVQLPDGIVYCVNYIRRDAPLAWIRACRFREDEILLSEAR